MASAPEALEIAIGYYQAGRLHEAEQICRQILVAQPTFADAWHLLGVIVHLLGQCEVATECLSRVLELDAGDAEAYNNLGMVFRSQGELVKAIDSFRRAATLRPNFAEAQCNLGNALVEQGLPDEAVECFMRAIEQRPNVADFHSGLGSAHARRGDLDRAIVSYRRALELRSDDPESHFRLGCVLQEQGKSDEAVASYSRAVELKPDFVEAHSNLGAALKELTRFDDAITCFLRALRLKPDSAELLFNLGTGYWAEGRFDNAAVYYRRAAEVDPGHAEARWNEATLALLRGDFEQGWPGFEWRWKTGQQQWRGFQQETWHGEPLKARTILLHAEQGLGDTIQFIRYASLIKDLGANVLLECQRPLASLLSRCKGIDSLICEGDKLPLFDCHLPILSVPRVLKTSLKTIPASVPYVFADPALVAEWQFKLQRVEGFRLGINWRGRAGRGSFQQRDIPPRYFAALAELPGVRLISLQKGAGQEELAALGVRAPIIDTGDDVDTANGPFMDTAAIMMNLDLVITSDTSIPHLAGALGVPVWLALPYVPDWRWLLDRSDSPWYPTMRLFRQKRPGDWAGVFEEMEGGAARVDRSWVRRPRQCSKFQSHAWRLGGVRRAGGQLGESAG